MNKENLLRMARHIVTIPPKKFNMALFRSSNRRKTECDSIGCAVGHCTVLDPDGLIYNEFGNIAFRDWSEKFTGLKTHVWHWCFSGGWQGIDDTPAGAAKRIIYLMMNGNVPQGFVSPHMRFTHEYQNIDLNAYL